MGLFDYVAVWTSIVIGKALAVTGRPCLHSECVNDEHNAWSVPTHFTARGG